MAYSSPMAFSMTALTSANLESITNFFSSAFMVLVNSSSISKLRLSLSLSMKE